MKGVRRKIILLLRLRVLVKSTSFYQGGDLGDNSTLRYPESPSLLTLSMPCINLFIFHLMYDVNTL